MQKKDFTTKATLYCGVAVFAGSLAVEALAQQEAIEEITVTARKREESLLEIPVSVTAFSQTDLNEMGINALDAVSELTPGFQFYNSGASQPGKGNANLSFRGLSVFQPNPTSSSGSIFWNGGYMAAGAAFLPLFDVGRVEIIKGPQTAFYGVNTFAGAVNFVPARPGDEFSANAALSYSPSDDAGYNLTAAAGGPLSETVGLRVAVMQERVGADWEYRNGEPFGEENTTSIMATMEFSPTDALTFNLNGFFVDSDDTHGQVTQVAPVLPGDCNKTYTGDFLSIATRQVTRSYTTDMTTLPRSSFCGEMPDFDVVAPNFSGGTHVNGGPYLGRESAVPDARYTAGDTG